MLWRSHSSLTLCCRYKAANEGIKLDAKECEAVMMAAWGMTDSSRVQQGERFIASQLLAASFQRPNLGGNLSCALWSLAVAELQEGIMFTNALFICTYQAYRGDEIDNWVWLCQSRSCFCTSSCFGSLIVGFVLLLLCFSVAICCCIVISMCLSQHNPQMHKGQDFHSKMSHRRQ